MQGLMQDGALSVNSIVTRAAQYFGDREIITRTVDGVDRSTVAEMVDEAMRIVTYLDDVGVTADGRVGTFGWNTMRHLALYCAIPSSGRVMHTINIRYFPDQLTYTIDHAQDEVVFVDRSLLPMFAEHLPKLDSVKHVVVIDDGATHDLPDDPRIQRYEDVVLGKEPTDLASLDARVTDEHQAAAICYTTGTTGNPKGVLYSHRSAWLHSNATGLATGIGLVDSDRVLPVVPMFHANAWGLPYGSLMAGAAMVMPGPDLSPGAILELMAEEKVTVSAGVPTIWMGLLPKLDDYDLTAVRAVLCGGSAVPRALSESFREKIGVPILQAWGMTETSPVATIAFIRGEFVGADDDTLADLRATAGITPPGVEIRIVDTETREPQPWDDKATGEVECRGPWVAKQYFRSDEPGTQFSPDGWLRTGDVAAISPLGYVRLVDRTKDLVKSGGEWISSVDLENALMGHPKVAEAAVIAVPHPKWSERPLACVVVKPGQEVEKSELLSFLGEKLSKWQLPDDVVFIDEVPKTSVGKFSKKTLREQFADYSLPTA